MNPDENPWDNEYLQRGRLWGGSARSLPRLPLSSSILELGCGNGKTVSSLLRGDCCVTAVDFSFRAVSLCRSILPDPEQVGILIADIRKTPFRDESFDFIIASHVTGHLTRNGRHKLAAEVLRLLIPGGMIFFCDFSVDDFRYGRGEETEAGTFTRKNGISTHYFCDDEVRTLFKGLTVHSMEHRQWKMQVRGTVFPRAEIIAEFKKNG